LEVFPLLGRDLVGVMDAELAAAVELAVGPVTAAAAVG
jgi:hypothetical protein